MREKGMIPLLWAAALLAVTPYTASCAYPQSEEVGMSVSSIIGNSDGELSEMEYYDSGTPSVQPETYEAAGETPYGLSAEMYDGSRASVVNGNVPIFTETDVQAVLDDKPVLSELDALGRCGPAYMMAGPMTLTTEKRGSIGHVRPAGWHTVKYPDLIEDNYLYNRAHLLAWSISSILDDPRNLTTGTRQCNLTMLDYEMQVIRYVEDTGCHVLYRVTPLYTGNDLVSYGILMEAQSYEDNGGGLSFCVICWNRQDGIHIDYATGDSWRVSDGSESEAVSDEAVQESVADADAGEVRTYVANANSMKFHLPECDSVSQMKEKNKRVVTGTYEDLVGMGYSPCGACLQ